MRARKTNRKPPANSDDALAPSPGKPVSAASSDEEAENRRVALERTTAEMDKILPPPPGIERQYFDGPLGARTRNRKREWELAVEGLEQLAAKRDYATARLTIIWLWQSAQVTQALTQDVQADLEAELPEIKQNLSLYERERAMLRNQLQQFFQRPLILIPLFFQLGEMNVRIDTGDEKIEHQGIRHHEEDANEHQLL